MWKPGMRENPCSCDNLSAKKLRACSQHTGWILVVVSPQKSIKIVVAWINLDIVTSQSTVSIYDITNQVLRYSIFNLHSPNGFNGPHIAAGDFHSSGTANRHQIAPVHAVRSLMVEVILGVVVGTNRPQNVVPLLEKLTAPQLTNYFIFIC